MNESPFGVEEGTVMTQDTATRFVKRINTDEQFRARVHSDPIAALAEYGLGTRVVGDEDTLRRLAAHTQPDARVWTWIKKTLSRVFCGPGGTRSPFCKSEPPSPTTQ
jgi:hypothetical protein